ncbi:NADH-quinone oxidoreductase subunit A [Flexivirga oryzae]|uniref:NADH-quinone oxidoreductase subunit n=1 Tax=Flexivirga oryzae TaxID=1794944 RepID=A0A839NBH1_9MICO|nr:NADH-quinone oxidoreductase subunit A [Flexivirga oryzae]MBB2892071.1 NADH-quinone oxidoreductase subunit A [Flexivirga oryzae]
MGDFVSILAALGLVLLAAVVVLVAHRLLTVGTTSEPVAPYLSGARPTEHALSRYHVRWYTVTLLFLAFDVEMLFMYAWALVVAEMGAGAVVEMFVFLGLLMAGVVYAWREGALRWV